MSAGYTSLGLSGGRCCLFGARPWCERGGPGGADSLMHVSIRALSTCLLSIFYGPGQTALLMEGDHKRSRADAAMSQVVVKCQGRRGEGAGTVGEAVILYGGGGEGFPDPMAFEQSSEAL